MTRPPLPATRRATLIAATAGGVAGFERGLKRLGLGADVGEAGGAKAEPLKPAKGSGLDHMRTLEQQVAHEGYVPGANRRTMETLSVTRRGQVDAVKERERRRRMNELEQRTTQQRADRAQAINGLLERLKKAGHERRAAAHGAWLARRDADAAAAAGRAAFEAAQARQAQGFDDYAAARLSSEQARFDVSAPQREEASATRAAEASSVLKLRRARTTEACGEIVRKLVELALVLTDARAVARRGGPPGGAVPRAEAALRLARRDGRHARDARRRRGGARPDLRHARERRRAGPVERARAALREAGPRGGGPVGDGGGAGGEGAGGAGAGGPGPGHRRCGGGSRGAGAAAAAARAAAARRRLHCLFPWS